MDNAYFRWLRSYIGTLDIDTVRDIRNALFDNGITSLDDIDDAMCSRVIDLEDTINLRDIRERMVARENGLLAARVAIPDAPNCENVSIPCVIETYDWDGFAVPYISETRISELAHFFSIDNERMFKDDSGIIHVIGVYYAGKDEDGADVYEREDVETLYPCELSGETYYRVSGWCWEETLI